jgi:hypothetical protein
MMRVRRVANVGLTFGVATASGRDDRGSHGPIFCYRVTWSDGRSVHSRGPVRMPASHRGWAWVDLVPALEIFVQ